MDELRAEIAALRERGDVPVGTPFEHLLALALRELLSGAATPVPWKPWMHISSAGVEHARLAMAAYDDGIDRLIEAQRAHDLRDRLLRDVERIARASALGGTPEANE